MEKKANIFSKNKKEKMIIIIVIIIFLILLIIGIFVSKNTTTLNDYDMSGISFSDETVAYDGFTHSLEINGDLPDGVSVSYTYDGEEVTGVTDTGTYSVIASFTGDTTEYNTISDMEATLTISTGTIDTANITFNDASYTYDGEEHSVEIEGDLPNGVSASYTYEDEDVTGVTEIGEYNVEAKISGDNYSTVTLTATLTIVEAIDYTYTLDTDNLTATLTKYTGSDTEIVTPTTVVDDGVTYDVVALYQYCFLQNYDITSLTISSGVISLGYSCFYVCTSLASIELPNTLTDLGNNSFATCTSLTSVTIPSSITILPDACFQDCTSLSSINIPDTMITFGNLCLGNTAITDIDIPDSTTSLEYQVFNNCKGITSVTIPSSVESIGIECFSGCSNLTTVIFEDSTDWIITNDYDGSTLTLSVTDQTQIATYIRYTYCTWSWAKSSS